MMFYALYRVDIYNILPICPVKFFRIDNFFQFIQRTNIKNIFFTIESKKIVKILPHKTSYIICVYRNPCIPDIHNKFFFIKEGEGNRLEAVTTDIEPLLAVQQGRGAQVRKGKLKLAKMVEVMGWKAVGAKLLDYSKSVEMEWVKSKGSQQPELFG